MRGRGVVVNDLETLFDKLYWSAILGVALMVSIVKTSYHRRMKIYLLSFAGGFISSVLFCYLGAEITLYFTGSLRFGLAVGGFFAWQGGDWVRKLIEDVIRDKFGVDRRQGD